MHTNIIILISLIAIGIAVALYFLLRHKKSSSSESYYIEKYTGSPCCTDCPCGVQLKSSSGCSIMQPKTPEILYAISPQALSDSIFNPIAQYQYNPMNQGMITLPVQQLYTY